MSNKSLVFVLIGIFGVSIAIYIIFNLGNGNSSSTTNTPVTTTVTQRPTFNQNQYQSSSSSTPVSYTYKDGTYSATSDYFVHGHSESIGVTIKISNGVVVSLTDQNSGNDGDSVMYQQSFEQYIKPEVLNVKLNDIALSRVGGASETTRGFMDAINQIKENAKV